MNFQGKNFLLEFLFSFSRNKLILEKKIKERFFSGKKTPQHFVYISFIFKRKKKSQNSLFSFGKKSWRKVFFTAKGKFFFGGSMCEKKFKCETKWIFFLGIFCRIQKKNWPLSASVRAVFSCSLQYSHQILGKKANKHNNRNFKHSFNILSCLFSVPEFHSVHIRCSYQFLLFVWSR